MARLPEDRRPGFNNNEFNGFQFFDSQLSGYPYSPQIDYYQLFNQAAYKAEDKPENKPENQNDNDNDNNESYGHTMISEALYPSMPPTISTPEDLDTTLDNYAFSDFGLDTDDGIDFNDPFTGFTAREPRFPGVTPSLGAMFIDEDPRSIYWDPIAPSSAMETPLPMGALPVMETLPTQNYIQSTPSTQPSATTVLPTESIDEDLTSPDWDPVFLLLPFLEAPPGGDLAPTTFGLANYNPTPASESSLGCSSPSTPGTGNQTMEQPLENVGFDMHTTADNIGIDPNGDQGFSYTDLFGNQSGQINPDFYANNTLPMPAPFPDAFQPETWPYASDAGNNINKQMNSIDQSTSPQKAKRQDTSRKTPDRQKMVKRPRGRPRIHPLPLDANGNPIQPPRRKTPLKSKAGPSQRGPKGASSKYNRTSPAQVIINHSDGQPLQNLSGRDEDLFITGLQKITSEPRATSLHVTTVNIEEVPHLKWHIYLLKKCFNYRFWREMAISYMGYWFVRATDGLWFVFSAQCEQFIIMKGDGEVLSIIREGKEPTGNFLNTRATIEMTVEQWKRELSNP
ncbi:hypothetical protein TWF730_011006 [Orbilia blumenaviensis]|uniref:Uncharacterized protein n=1 Tax=Orbilia blumenaviensis TaxID=1796055 RepID=A0AAV9UMC5_9PEZI